MGQLNFGAFTDAAWAVRPDGSSQGGLIISSTSTDLLAGKQTPMGLMDWKSWKLAGKARSSLAAEAQASADAVDMWNYLRLLVADTISPQAIGLRHAEKYGNVCKNHTSSQIVNHCMMP